MKFNTNRNKHKIPKYSSRIIFTVIRELSPILNTGDIFYSEHGSLININETIVLPNRKHIRNYMEIKILENGG